MPHPNGRGAVYAGDGQDVSPHFDALAENFVRDRPRLPCCCRGRDSEGYFWFDAGCRFHAPIRSASRANKGDWAGWRFSGRL